MTTAAPAVRQYQPIAQPARPSTNVSQATAVEQSRAVAEVQAAVLVAQQNRRNKSIAVEEMRESTAQQSVADRAFFRFNRGGGAVSGPSIHLARELARCWGNIQYGVSELRRDDDKAESEMLAFAWDLETNARNATTFIVPHKRDTKQGVKQLTDMRDIYENNANAGARRVRECIFAVLPSWFIDEATDRCNQTLEHGGGIPLPRRIANVVKAFEELGVSRQQLEVKIGRSSDQWNEHDVSKLGVIGRSIKNGEINKEDEFDEPAAATSSVSAASVRNRRKATDDSEQKATTSAAGKPSVAQLTELSELLTKDGKDTSDSKIEWLSKQVDRRLKFPNDLTPDEVDQIIGELRTAQAEAADADQGGAQ